MHGIEKTNQGFLEDIKRQRESNSVPDGVYQVSRGKVTYNVTVKDQKVTCTLPAK